MSEWRKCTGCKKSISFQTRYWVCNVTTCQKKRAGLVFCSPSCWDAHVPVLRHKESWAIEMKSPSPTQWQEIQNGTREDCTYPKRERATPVEEEAIFNPKKRDPNAPISVIRRRKPDDSV